MKKFTAALLAMTIGAGAFAATETLVYDYKASFKRIDAQYKIKSIANANYKNVTDAYTVKSDTIYGYVVLPDCAVCDPNNGVADFDGSGLGFAYLTRRGDTYAKKAGLKRVVKTNVRAQAGIFGAYVDLKAEADKKNLPLRSANDIKKAWMSLDFALPGAEDTQDLNTEYVVKAAASGDPLTYGFYGLDNKDASHIRSTGFGAATVKGPKALGPGWCPDDREPGDTCARITSISGSLIGYPKYQGDCGITPMWKVCFDANNSSTEKAVVAGTWTLKFNKGLSEDNGAMTRSGNLLAEAEKKIFKKLNLDAAKLADQLIDITDEERLLSVDEMDAKIEDLTADNEDLTAKNEDLTAKNDKLTNENTELNAAINGEDGYAKKLEAAEKARDDAMKAQKAAEDAKTEALGFAKWQVTVAKAQAQKDVKAANDKYELEHSELTEATKELNNLRDTVVPGLNDQIKALNKQIEDLKNPPVVTP